MKILKVIHGYPMRYNAGSEVYSQNLCRALADRGHDVHVFTRQEDPFQPDGVIQQEVDPDDSRIKLYVINNPRNRDRYRVTEIDSKFAELLQDLRPEIVHIGHLNHLSTNIVNEIKKVSLPIVYTLHDYWLMCPRGQFIQMKTNDDEVWKLCDGQENKKCASQCYARYFSGSEDEYLEDLHYWESWVLRRMRHIREIAEKVDLFISPSNYLRNRYNQEFGIPEERNIYLDYGFDLESFCSREREPENAFSFGYIGTHIPAKGIDYLIKAFRLITGNATLRIWGRERGQETQSLKRLASTISNNESLTVEWMGEYRNDRIVPEVFNKIDAIVVPSIWAENSPLVIHEAQQARVPVITADAGGMSEYVRHGVNGLLFSHRDFQALREQMQKFVDDPMSAESLGERGYLYSADGNVPDLEQHVLEIENLYESIL
jgi:glycosyltransferase involved in cell wall biosynthesis